MLATLGPYPAGALRATVPRVQADRGDRRGRENVVEHRMAADDNQPVGVGRLISGRRQKEGGVRRGGEVVEYRPIAEFFSTMNVNLSPQ